MTTGMHRQVWSTKGLPVREQFAFWRELVCRQLITLSYDRDERSDAPFVGEMAVRPFGEARLVEFHAEGRRVVSRGRSELARLREPTCHVYQQLVGTYHYQARGREHVLRPGDLMVTAPEVAFEGRPEGDSSFRSWALPPGRLLARLPGGAVPLLHVPRRPGVGELVASAADALAGQADHLGPAVADAALDNLCALIGIAGGTLPDALEGGREAVRAARLTRARQHIDRHLHDPGLDSAGVAHAVGISERQLQLLFEHTGETFTAYLTRRRLEEVRAALARPGIRSVTELALTWGFGSVPTFYRAFRRAYGAPPGELRAAGI